MPLTLASVTAAYRRAMGPFETVVLRRLTGNTPSAMKLEVTVRARVMGLSEAELAGGITQDNQVLLMLAEDLTAAQFPAPPRKGDQVVVRGRTAAVEFVDPLTRSIGGTSIAFRVRVRG